MTDWVLEDVDLAWYHMPAEWTPHEATWVSWPHRESSWPGDLPKARVAFARFVATLSRYEPVHVNVNDAAMEAEARRHLADHGPLGEIVFERIPTDDAWCRDYGAIVVVRKLGEDVPPSPGEEGPGVRGTADPARVALDFGYNSWGEKYPPFELDNTVPVHMAERLDLPRAVMEMILEGGSIDIDGEGLLLTTESCLLNPNRNPDLSRDEIERRLRGSLGVDTILWLGEGIVGDDTDGHVDDLTRFVAPRSVVTAVETDPDDANYEPLQQNLDRLRHFDLPDGGRLKLTELPMPRPVMHGDHRLPASYANFYIANDAVFVPFYDRDRDEEAREILASLFPDREVIGLEATPLVWGLGAFHCLTQQVPRAE